MAEQRSANTESIVYALAARSITAQPAKRTGGPAIPRSQEVCISLVADHNRRFPGESLFLYVRLQTEIDLTSCGIEVRIPEGLILVDSFCLQGDGPIRPTARTIDGDLYLTYDFTAGAEKKVTYEYVLETVVAPARDDYVLDVTSVILARAATDGSTAAGPVIRDEESLGIAIAAKSSYVRYLPSLYTRDELMGRFLMLFESFLSPISQQIREVPYVFDPTVTPADMLPWLASWLDLQLDPEWPESQRRALLKSARRLYQKRGTAAGLREYLQIYTGGEVQIIEHRADNLVVGQRADLGNSVALGRDNRPHTFTVIVRLAPGLLESDVQRQQWYQRITVIIDREKPVHTAYTLRLEPLDE